MPEMTFEEYRRKHPGATIDEWMASMTGGQPPVERYGGSRGPAGFGFSPTPGYGGSSGSGPFSMLEGSGGGYGGGGYQPPWMSSTPYSQSVAGDVWDWTKGAAGDVVDWVSDNPELVTGIAATAADVYGAHQADKRAKEQMEQQQKQFEEEMRQREEEARRRARQEQLRMLMQAMASFRPGPG